jgi:hypothetical protein
MSNSNRLLVLVVVCFSMGGALVLMGSGGPGLPIAAVSLGAGALALAGSLVLRRREPRSQVDASTPPATPGPSRGGTIGAVAGGVLGAGALLLTFTVAEGEARGHGTFHLLFGVVLLGLFVAVDRWWHSREGTTTAASFRTPLLVVLWIALAGAFLESVGAAGYDELNAAHRIGWLTTVHNAVTPLGALSLLAIPMGFAALAAAFVAHLRTRRIATS